MVQRSRAKLDELIRAGAAHNRFIGVEDLTEEELAELRPQSKGPALLKDAMSAADDAENAANALASEAAEKAQADFSLA